jgi:tRNA(Arg) A34 adenosine deaminase TadA
LESQFDEQWMWQALAAAREAQASGEVPIGTCIVSEN